jgi:hypothetical protein
MPLYVYVYVYVYMYERQLGCGQQAAHSQAGGDDQSDATYARHKRSRRFGAHQLSKSLISIG